VFVVLGTVLPESFLGGFQDLLFDESQSLFEDQQGKCLLIISRLYSLYFVGVELHDRSKCCATFARLTGID
jgi:hypothetical protein